MRFSGNSYILGTSMIEGIQKKEFNSKLNKCSTQFRPFISAAHMETYVKPILNDDKPVALILHVGSNDTGNKQLKTYGKWNCGMDWDCKSAM